MSLETLVEAGTRGYSLSHTVSDITVLPQRDRLGCEVVDAGYETNVNEAAEELHA